MISPPPGWSNDELTSFIDLVRNNAYATFHNHKWAYGHLRDIDRAFLAVLEGFSDPPDLASIPLIYRAHASYRAAVQLAMGGQAAECYMVLRGVIEHVMYAHHIHLHPASFEIWQTRNEGPEQRKHCKREFAGYRIFTSLRDRDPNLAAKVTRMYERTIDYGAHPNQASVFSSLNIEETEGLVNFEVNYLAHHEHARRFVLRSCAQAGVLVLDIVATVFPDRAMEVGLLESTAVIKPFL